MKTFAFIVIVLMVAPRLFAEESDAFNERLVNNVAQALKLYPEAAEEGSELYVAVQNRIKELKQANPDYFNNPDWPIPLIAEEAGKIKGKRMERQESTPIQGQQKQHSIREKADARGLTIEEYQELDLYFRSLDGKVFSKLTPEEQEKVTATGHRLGITHPRRRGINQIEYNYWLAIYEGKSPEYAAAKRQADLIEEQNQILRAESEQRRRDAESLRRQMRYLQQDIATLQSQ